MEDDVNKLLTVLEAGGSGLSLLELARDVALVSPAVNGVSAFMPLIGSVYLHHDNAAPLRVRAGELALVPRRVSVRVAARSNPAVTLNSRDHLVRHGAWTVCDGTRRGKSAATVAAAQITGSREVVLEAVMLVDVGRCAVGAPLFALLQGELQRGATAHAGFAAALVNACVVHALRERAAMTAHEPPRRAAGHGRIARAIAAIRDRVGDTHSVDSLAELAGMSRSSFTRRFAARTGMAPQRFLQHVRLEEAAALLASTALPVKAIAAMTGFASRSHFSRAFREAFHVDPSTYRRDGGTAEVPDRPE